MEKEPLTWYPLYWVYNDCWQWTYTKPAGKYNQSSRTISIPHPGHVHFFMMDFPPESNSQQAYHGEQKYSFEYETIWGDDSGDINQQNNIRIVGRPKWYFYMAEYWRRIYIQNWEDPNNNFGNGVTDKKGIKYDASKDCHSRGPFREGKDNYFFSTSLNRTLPVEYWKNHEKTVREHYLRNGEGVKAPQEWDFGINGSLGSYPKQIKNIPGQTTNQNGEIIKNPEPNQTNPEEYPWENYFKDYDDWTIPREFTCKGDLKSSLFPGTASYSDEDKARWNYPDKYFISPVIEYQKVVHLNWERLPGFEKNDVDKEVDDDGIETGENFGDDWEIEITSPFKIDGKIQSPFSDDFGKVYPAGVYCHELDKKGKIKPLKYNKRFYDPNVKNEDAEIDGINKQEVYYSMNKCFPTKDVSFNENGEQNVVKWNFPEGFPVDGRWVEQCLGAMVIAKARVVLENNFGERSVKWITNTAFSLGNTFVGMDDKSVDQSNVGKPSVDFTSLNLTKDPVTGKQILVLSDTIMNKFIIIDNDGDIRALPQSQVGTDTEIDFTGITVTGTWRIEFPK